MSDDSGESKSEDASSSKLRKQRNNGQFLKSQNFPTHLKYCIGVGLLYGFYDLVVREFGNYFSKVANIISYDTQRTDVLIILDFNALLGMYVLLFIIILIASVFFAHGIFSGGFPISFELIKFKFENISPGKGLKRIVGRRQQTEIWIGIFQSIVWILLALTIIYWFYESTLSTIACGLICISMVAYELFFTLIGLSLFIVTFIIILDLLIQQSLFQHEMKMTKSEATRDQKESFGDPKIKQEIRRRGYEILFGNDSESMVTEHKNVDDSSFVLVGNKDVVAIRFSPDDATPIPVVVSASTISDDNVILKEARKNNKTILTGEILADEIGTNVAPGSILEEVHFEALANIIKSNKLGA